MSDVSPELVEQFNLVVDAIREDRLDEAEVALEALHELDPRTKELMVYPVMIAIQRGKLDEVLQQIYALDEDRCPELKATCLRLIGDPVWEGIARNLAENSPHFHVRYAMQVLLGQEPEERPEEGTQALVQPASYLPNYFQIMA